MDNNKYLAILLVVSLVFLTGCAGEKSTDEALYGSSWILHNINDSTPTVLEAVNYGIYKFSYNIPAGSPQYYLFWYYFISPNQNIAGAIDPSTATPLTKTNYLYTSNDVPQNYMRNYSFTRFVNINSIVSESWCSSFAYGASKSEEISDSAWNSINPKQGEIKDFSFGGPYKPGSIIVEDNLIKFKGKLFEGKNSFVREYTDFGATCCLNDCESVSISLERPRYKLYEDGNLIEERDLVNEYYYSGKLSSSNWNENYLSYYAQENKKYRIEAVIPTYYSIFNKTNITTEFSTYKTDRSPPWLANIDISPRYKLGQPLAISISAGDDVSVNSIKAYFKNSTSDWKKISFSSGGGSPGTKTSAGNFIPYGEKIDLKIFLNDTSGNNQTYIIESASFREEQLTVELYKEPFVLSPGTKARFYGKIKDSNGKGVSDLLIRKYFNGNQTGKELTTPIKWQCEDYNCNNLIKVEGGNFSFFVDVPLDYSDNTNISLLFGGTGIYQLTQYIINGFAQIFEKDVAVSELVTPNVMFVGNNLIDVAVSNGGSESQSALLEILFKGEVIDFRTITLASKESRVERFNSWIPTPDISWYGANISARISLDGDMNPANNELSVLKYIYIDIDASAGFVWSGNFVRGESKLVKFDIKNQGTKGLNNIKYTLDYTNETEQTCTSGGNCQVPVYTIISSGTIDYLASGGIATKKSNILFNESGGYILRLRVDAEGDKNPNNNISYSFITVKARGADLSGWFEYKTNPIVGKIFNLTVYIDNTGSEKTINGTVSLFYYKGYCNLFSEYSCDNLTLIDSRDIKINAEDSLTQNFSMQFNELGGYTLILILNATNEVNSADNIVTNYLTSRLEGPDPLINIDWNFYYTNIIVGQKTEIPFVIYNFGTENATNVSVNLYNVFGSSKENAISKELIGTKLIENIGIGDLKYINFSYTPLTKGDYEFYFNISSENDIDNSNNYGSIIKTVLSNGQDVQLRDIWTSGPIGVNTPAYIYIAVRDMGTQMARNVNISVYINNKYLSSEIAENLSGGDVYYFNWTPKSKGDIIISAVAQLEGDVDKSDNEKSMNVSVQQVKQVNVSLTDSAGKIVNRYLYTDFGNYLTDQAVITVTIPEDGTSEFILANFLSRIEGESSGVSGLSLNYPNLSDNERIISDYIPKLSDVKDYYAVFANNLSFKYDNLSVIIEMYNNTYLSSLGVNTSSISDYTLFVCKKYDFADRKCIGIWQQPEEVNFYSNPYDNTYSFIAKTYMNVNAFAIAESKEFDGDSTDLKLSPDIIKNFVREILRFGKIRFIDEINLSRIKDSRIDMSTISFKQGRIVVDTSRVPELNVSAELLFRNINLRNPQILYNGDICSSSVCSNLFYNQTSQTVSLNVTHFSSYEVVEGPYCGDGNINAGETCSNCVADAGACGGGDGGRGGGGGGGGGGTGTCTARWNCTWGPCTSHSQSQVCTDLNNCRTTAGKPAEQTKVCLIESDCTDFDKDGYGAGTGCLGLDLNDNDPGITDKLINKQDNFESVNIIIIITTLGLIILIVIVIIVIVVLRKKKLHVHNVHRDNKPDFRLSNL